MTTTHWLVVTGTTLNMDSRSQTTANPDNWLDGCLIPAELLIKILENIGSHKDLLSLSKTYPQWVSELSDRYLKKRFATLWDDVLGDIDERLHEEVILAYQIRKVRKDYATAMGSSQETQQDRDRLEQSLRGILSLHNEYILPEVEEKLATIFDLADVVRDVTSLTHRYSNDAWERLRGVAEATGTGPVCCTGLNNPPKIKLTRAERFKMHRAFLRVEIYLLTKFWTNSQGERHILDVGDEIEPYIPAASDGERFGRYERLQFDSCLRYMFDAYRRYVKDTARALGAPELPPRDDLAWVRNEDEDEGYEFEDYPTPAKGDPALDFAHRSVSEEQGLLLWLCERGIGALEQTHQAGDGERRDELLRHFGRRHVWETVELRHRFSRYDLAVDKALWLTAPEGYYQPEEDRNRHPVMSLYGSDEHQRYSSKSSPWACASAFLTWDCDSSQNSFRADIKLNRQGAYFKEMDTDRGRYVHTLTGRRSILRCTDGFPYGHPYMFESQRHATELSSDACSQFWDMIR